MDKYYIKYVLGNRLRFIFYFFLIVFFLIILRFFYIQILQNNYYSIQAIDNSIRILPIAPARGLIFDRNNIIIADNKLNYSLEIVPEKIENLSMIVGELNKIVSIEEKDIKKYKRILKNKQFSNSIPIKSNLTIKEAAQFASTLINFRA